MCINVYHDLEKFVGRIGNHKASQRASGVPLGDLGDLPSMAGESYGPMDPMHPMDPEWDVGSILRPD